MPIQRGSVTLSRFRVIPDDDKAPPADPKRWLSQSLRHGAFEPIDRKSDEDRAIGFVELEDSEGTGFSPGSYVHGERVLFGFRVDQLRVPGSQVKAELAKWTRTFEQENDRKPAKAEKAQAREAIVQMLRSRAVPSTKVADISWNLKTGQLQIWAASRKAVEEIQLSIEEAFKVKLQDLVPAEAATRAGIEESSLTPTPELVGGAMLKEVIHGEA
jgi:recombination associated protein RdgC